MKQLFTVPILCLLLFQSSTAQSPPKERSAALQQTSSSSRSVQAFIYNFTSYSDTYTELTGAISLNNGEIWDEPEYIMPMAFPFVLNGNDISELTFYGGGSLMIAPTADPDVYNYIFPFEADLVDRGSFGNTSLSPISYKVEGTPGSRIQKLEFKNAGSYIEMDFEGTLNMFVNFQMWLFEGSNKIEYHFGPNFINDPNLFYDDSPGPICGTTDYNENDDILSNAHFIIGAASNPSLSANPTMLNGTPADGMVYRLYISIPIDLTVSGEDATSFCNPNGSASATVTGGTEPYTYLWSTGATTPTIVNLNSGTYSVTITDDDGTTASGSVSITNVAPIDLTVSSTDETGVGANDGTAEVEATGGSLPYTYLWSNGETTASIESLPPGVYSIVVTDNSGCTAEESVSINAFGCPDLTLEMGVTNINCFGLCDGILTVLEVNQGTSPYTYNWNDGSTTASIQNLCAGNYSVTVVDANGCIVIGSYEVIQPTELVLTAGSTNESLQNHNDGTAWAIPTGGTAPYSYEWSNGATDSLIINLPAGTYTITVTDDNLCTAMQEVTITAGPCGILEAQIINATCFDDCDGSIELTFTNATLPVSYEWNTGDTTSTISDYCSGGYMITATDQAGCVLTGTFFIQDPPELLTNGGSTDETIVGGDGSAWVTPTGGTPPYLYLWDNGSTDSLIVNLSPGEYFVTVTDAHGCEAGESIIVNEFSCLSGIFFAAEPITCHGACNGEISVVTFGGEGPFSFQWNTGDTTGFLINVCPGTYELTITDEGQNCTSSAFVDILEPDSLFAILDEVVHLTDTTSTGIYISIVGGNPPYHVSWSDENGNNISSAEDLVGIDPGFYSVSISDLNGCEGHIDSIEVLDMTVGISPIHGWNLEVYPNPAHDRVFIKGTDASDFEIQLLSTDGQELKSWKNASSLDVHEISPGLYILKFSSGKNSLIKSLVILR